MEINNMKLDELREYRNELLKFDENEHTPEEINANTAELRSIREREEAILKSAEERKAERKRVAEDTTLKVVKDFKKESEERKVENVNIEERAKNFAESGKMVVDAKEARSILLATGTLAKPTEINGINAPQNIMSSVIDMVAVENLSGVGSYTEAYQKTYQTADLGEDGVAPTPNDPVFRTVAINPFIVDTLTYVSRNVKRQTPLDYEAKVRQGAMIALKKKVVNFIVKGNGSTQPFGIYNAVNTEVAPESMTQELLVGSTTIDEKTLRTIVFAYGGDENMGAGARLFLNKNDLIAFGDVRGANEKKAIYEITPDGSNPNTGIIKDGGLSVPYIICSDVTSLAQSTKGAAKIPTIIYGDPSAYKIGLFGDYEVRVSEDYKFAEGLLSVKGEAMVGGNVRFDKGFVVVTLDDNVV